MLAARAILVLVLAAGSAGAQDFDTEIVPVFTKAGCNAGACHGAAVGRGGFKLSLLGGDAAADYDAVVHALKGRRVNLAHPGESLLLAKPTGVLLHEGGIRLDAGGAGEKRLLAWIAAGAPRAKKQRRLTHFDVGPADTVADKTNQRIAFTATARFDNGPPVDVAAWTVFTSGDPTAVELDGTGATVRRRGRHFVLARFLDRVVPVRITVPLGEAPVDLAREPRVNFIDDEILKTLTALRLPVSPRADDAAFLRRATLDLTGALPTPEALAAYLADPAADKRTRLIDTLLESDGFVDYWTFRFATLYRIRPLPNEPESATAFHAWVREQVRTNAPYDRTARALLTATGDSHAVGAANFARLAGDARGHAELAAGVFLGIRLQCANCHNHPLDRWTQDDYHGLAAVFAKLDRGRTVRVLDRGGVTNPRTGEPAVPRIPGDRNLAPAADGRAAFADWLTAPDNRTFARATVNRLWRALFGRGLVDPTDDLRDTNPATHPELLDRLAADFVAHRYDLRHTLRRIATSEAYARGSAALPANRIDDRYYSHALARPLEPERLADAIAAVTGVPDRYGNLPPGTRAIALVDASAPAPSLDALGRCSRAAPCEGESATGGLPAKLHLLNGDLVNRKVAAKEGRLHGLIAAGTSDAAIVAAFYGRALGRPPTKDEAAFWAKRLAVEDRTAACEDFLWSLLNCREFATNH